MAKRPMKAAVLGEGAVGAVARAVESRRRKRPQVGKVRSYTSYYEYTSGCVRIVSNCARGIFSTPTRPKRSHVAVLSRTALNGERLNARELAHCIPVTYACCMHAWLHVCIRSAFAASRGGACSACSAGLLVAAARGAPQGSRQGQQGEPPVSHP